MASQRRVETPVHPAGGPELVLGTAQLGSDYGIANSVGKPSRLEAYKILELAWKKGIRRFDTAPGYDSEEILGDFCTAHGIGKDIRVLTKVSCLSGTKDWQGALEKSVAKSLKRTKVDQIETVFFHHPEDTQLLTSRQDAIQDVTEKNPINWLGLSVYTREQVEVLGGRTLEKLAVQFPYNVIDRRFENGSRRMGQRYARSILLQGILAAEKLKPDAPCEAKAIHKLFHSTMNQSGYESIRFALRFLNTSSVCDYCLIGAENMTQLAIVTDIWKDIVPHNFDYCRFSSEVVERIAPEWLDPRVWS